MKRSGGDEIFGGDIWEFWHSREPPKCSALLGRAPFQIGNWDEQENRTRTKPKGHTNNKSQNKDRRKRKKTKTKTEKHIKTKTKAKKTNRKKAGPLQIGNWGKQEHRTRTKTKTERNTEGDEL